VIRVRYADGLERQRLRRTFNLNPPSTTNTAGTAELGRQVEGAREDLERSLLEILVQMSYSRDFGPGPGNNVILQPEESFEELIRRFGLGNENRGASQAVIDSYPVEVVRGEEEEEIGSDESEGDEDRHSSSYESGSGSESERDEDDESSQGAMETDDCTSEMGTCGICLEDYKEGESMKTLACPNHPHSFHKECIDKWLKLVASCPICKNNVGMYKEPTTANS